MNGPEVLRLPRAFYSRDSVTVARALLGQRLVRILDGRRLAGRISETEAYGGPNDPSSHAYRRTRRSAIMYGAPGFAYVYFIYGSHYCLNAVTNPDGMPGAVLIRALAPSENLPLMRLRRGLRELPENTHDLRGVADGPGKLCQALGITLADNGCDLVESGELFVEEHVAVADAQIEATPRIGVRGDEEARTRPWRFRWLAPLGQEPT